MLSVQDEMVGLELALNVAEEKTRGAEGRVREVEGEVEKFRQENEALVRRWVARVGVEAREAGIDERTDFRGGR